MNKRKKRQVGRRSGSGRKAPARRTHHRPGKGYPAELRLRVVRQVMEQGLPVERVADAFGIGRTTLSKWIAVYQQAGPEELARERRSKARPKERDVRHEAAVGLKQEHPDYGSRRIRDVLRRFEGLGVSDTVVRRVLHEAGLMEPAPEPRWDRQRPARRFERAEPNQLWQSDIFTFLLRRHERLYLTAFMDDHSRFIVSHALAHHQKSTLVMEALERGIAAYGTPREVLTDNGRQYTAWRGTTVFEETLRREGIAHVKSRPQHPQTLGKVERFWKTLWDEFLSRTVFADFDDCARRLKLFIDAYNFQRPHQALGGLVPADRFFRAAPQVREAIERSVAENALRLAHQRPTVKPFYLVGRMGDRDVSIAADAGGLRVRLGDEQPQRIDLGKEEQHGSEEVPNRLRAEAARGLEAQAARTTDAEVAARAAGPGRDGAAALPDDSERAEWGEAGLGADRRVEHLSRDVLRARGAGAQRHGPGTDAGQPIGRHERGSWLEEAHRGAGEEGGPAREGQAPGGAPVADDEEPAPPGQGGAERGPEKGLLAPATLDEAWQQAFEEFDRAEDELDRCNDELGDVEAPAHEPFHPLDGWRGRALRWERKLTGADATDNGPWAEGDDGPEAEHDEDEVVRAGAFRAGGVLREVHAADGSSDGPSERGGGGAAARHEPKPLPDVDAPGPLGAHRGDHPAPGGAPTALGAGGGARGAGGTAGAAGGEAGERSADLAPLARCGERGAAGSGATEPGAPETYEEDLDLRRGTGGAGA